MLATPGGWPTRALLRALQTPQRAECQCRTPLGKVLHLRANNLIFIIHPTKGVHRKQELPAQGCLFKHVSQEPRAIWINGEGLTN